MRVISGKYKSRKLVWKVDKTISLRPLRDSAKEFLFNVLNNDFENKTVLDLFCGTGQIGIEFLSRGAKRIYFVDLNKKAEKILLENLNNLNVRHKQYFFWKIDVFKSLKIVERNKIFFDYIFIDFPYIFSNKINLVNKLLELDQITSNVLIIFHLDDNEALKLNLKEIKSSTVSCRKSGRSTFVFVQKK